MQTFLLGKQISKPACLEISVHFFGKNPPEGIWLSAVSQCRFLPFLATTYGLHQSVYYSEVKENVDEINML